MTVLRTVIVFLLLMIVPFVASAEEVVVARVAGVPVTAYELQRQMNKVMPLRVSFHGSVSTEKIMEIKQEAIEDLIIRALKVKYAVDSEISVPASQIDEQIEKVKGMYKTEKDFITAVGDETLTGLRASIYRQFLANEAEKVAVTSKIQVSDDELKNYYAEKKHTFFMPKQYRASHILIKVDPASNADEVLEYKKKAQELLDRARKGEDFYDLAYFNSDDRTKFVGGDLGVFHEGQAEKPFEDALLAMKVGDISDIVKTRYGFHIIKLTQVNEPRQLDFDEVRLKIKATFEKERHDKIYSAWIDDLKQKYKVERLVE